jgi:hypothetical protein
MPGPNLSCPESSDTGAYRIAWTAAEGSSVRVEENAELLYEGRDLAATVSGRPAGQYVYRAVVVEDGGGLGPWSESCTVVVSPPSLALAFALFGVGLVVFLSLVAVVVRGHRRGTEPSGGG